MELIKGISLKFQIKSHALLRNLSVMSISVNSKGYKVLLNKNIIYINRQHQDMLSTALYQLAFSVLMLSSLVSISSSW